MKISIDWLQEYVDLSLPAAALAEKLTMSGLEVDEIVRIGSDLDGVIVGSVVEVRAHPNADRLTVCRVDVGGGETLQIICGAPNVAAGQKVPVATIGSTLTFNAASKDDAPASITIKRARIRGEVSEGMICAEDELGLSEDHSGIMVLDEDASVGSPFSGYLRMRGTAASDVVLDVAITPNRPDATSHFGVARDVAALTSSTFSPPELPLPATTLESVDGVGIRISAPEACRRYVGIIVRGVSVGESPEWLKRRLTAVGLRPRNNVVDVTNFVMYECGQPLHAFDLRRLAGPAIDVRVAAGGESFVTLDGRRHDVPDGTLLICDAEKPVAIAGIMGGANSEVADETTDILIESAYFDPTTIRRAAKKLGLQTDSSYRFERGVDAEGQLWAAARAAQLITSLAGGTVVEPAIDVHPSPLPRRTVAVRPGRANRVLGTQIPTAEMHRLLTSIGFNVDEEDGVLTAEVPPFRPDIEREIDVIEEIARLYGYDRIPEPERSNVPNVVPWEDPADALKVVVRERLAGLGLHEIHTNSMLRVETAERFARPPLVRDAIDGVVETLNPISREMAALRPSLLPGVLNVIGFNQNHGQPGLAFFEFGHVFARGRSPENVLEEYWERDHLLIAATGHFVEGGWSSAQRATDIFDLRGIVEHLLDVLGAESIQLVPVKEASTTTSYHIDTQADGASIGLIGCLADAIQTGYGIDTPIYFVEIDWTRLAHAAASTRVYRPVSRYPVVERDLAVVVPRDREAGRLREAIRSEGAPLLRDVHLFDLYEGAGIPEGTRSLAYTLRFAADRTLTDQEVDERVDAIIMRLRGDYGAELRR